MPDNDPKLMTVFAEALERTDPAARAAYLDAACGDDAALRRRVEALLAAHDGAGRFLEPDFSRRSETVGPETEGAARTSVPDTHSASQQATSEHRPDGTPTTAGSLPADRPGGFVPGQVIAGRYTLLDVLGEGGMGTVYRAGQTEPVKRQVALKLIKIGLDSRAVLARFDAERQALALMDHPNIARVYDGGTTAAGQPFFVMELVSGVPITEYCDWRRLSVPSRLELFVTVCQAVQHAHQKGIIHRDLKPGNVLVTEVDGRPTPKVIDFGVARATEQKLTDLSLMDTGAIVGTPAYMSPEQADPASRDIDTRTDVYALGVILYELLAGSPPIDAKQFRRGAFLEMLRMVREIDPPRPSTKVSTSDALPSIAASRDIEPEQLKRALRGDLDWIVMKALEKDRTRRYETANGFAADVRRHLAHEPVQAAPPSRAYRLRKFVRKHRGTVIAASLVVLALLGGIAGTTWGLIRAENRRGEAEKARAAEAERLTERDDALRKEAERVRERNAAVKLADARADELKYQLGVSDMALAASAYGSGDVALASERLSHVPHEQRGWEWHYLKRLTRGGLFTLYGHTGAVNTVAFSRDGTRMLTCAEDATVRVWDARTGAPLLKLNVKASEAAFSPDGTRILTGTRDGTARVWDARTGTPLLELKGHMRGLWSASFSADGTRIVAGSTDSSGSAVVKVLDALTGATLLELKGHRHRVSSAAFSPDGMQIVTSIEDLDPAVKVWDARTGTPLLELKGLTQWVNSVAFSPDGTRILTTDDWASRVWDAQTGKLLRELKSYPRGVRIASFSPDGTRIVAGRFDGHVEVWEARTGTPLLDLRGHTGAVESVAFSPDSTRILTGSRDETAKVWDAQTDTDVLELKGQSHAAAFSPDGTRVVTGGRWSGPKKRWQVRIWDARTGTRLLEPNGYTGYVSSVAFSPDGTRILTSSDYHTAKVWDAGTGSLLLNLKGHRGQVFSASFSPDGTRIVTCRGDQEAGGVRVWDARSGAPLLDLKGYMGDVSSVVFTPDGMRIVTGGANAARVWDAQSGMLLAALKGHMAGVSMVAFSPDGTRILTGSGDETVKVWDARTGTPLMDLRGLKVTVSCLAFSPDGTRILAGGGDQVVKIFDARPGPTPLELTGHAADVREAIFSPDGTRVVTSSDDATARVWDSRTGTLLVELKGHTGRVSRAAFAPDGTRIATGSDDAIARVWDARTGAPLLELKGLTGSLWSVAFSPDGTRILTNTDQTAKVWDAKTGALFLNLRPENDHVPRRFRFSRDGAQILGELDDGAVVWYESTGWVNIQRGYRITRLELDESAVVWDARTGQKLNGLPALPIPQPGRIGPDGRWIAQIVRNRVELIPLQPDEDELSYRRLVMQPNFERYRDAYDAATNTDDQFAARFYLNLFPPRERALIRAEPIVAPLFDRLLLRDDVLAALQAQPVADPEIQAACLELAGTWPEPADQCCSAAWSLVDNPGLTRADYERGLRLASVACRLDHENAVFLNILGRAQYRCGLMAEALATLTRTNALNEEKEPSDLAFLALTHHRLGQSDKARDALRRLREAMKDPQWADQTDAEACLREAETIELDRAFPADPFAP